MKCDDSCKYFPMCWYIKECMGDIGDDCDEYKPERPHGEWIWKKDGDALRTYDLLCSECGYKTFTCENYDNVEQAKKVVDDRIREGHKLFFFCPYCGADMRKEGEAE